MWKRFCFLCIASLFVPQVVAADGVTWSFKCDVDACEERFLSSDPNVFEILESEANLVWKWLNSNGFEDPAFKHYEGFGAAEEAIKVKGPQMRVQTMETMGWSIHNADPSVVLGSYNVDDKLIKLNAGLKAKFLDVLKKQRKSGSQSLNRIEGAHYLSVVDTLAHEIYHGVQTAEGDVNDDVGWLVEGTAEAVGSAYVSARVSRKTPRTMNYDESLPTMDRSDGYHRGHFFLSAGKVINHGAPVKYLAGLFGTADFGGAFALDWFDKFLKEAKNGNGEGLHQIYAEVIANHAADRDDYENLQTAIDVQRQGDPEIEESVLKPWSAHARDVAFKTRAFEVPANTEDKAFMALASIEIMDQFSPKHARLIINTTLRKTNRADWLVDVGRVVTNETKLFTRVTNMPREKIDEGQKETIALQAKIEVIEFAIPTCIGRGGQWQIEAHGLPDGYPIRYEAARGTIDNTGLYTAPDGGSVDQLYVYAHGAKTDGFTDEKKALLTEIKLNERGCPFQLISSDGYSFTYDPDSQMSLAKGPSGPEKAYFDREHIYGYDPSTGWVKMHKSVMARFGAQMSNDTGGLTDLGPKMRKTVKACKGFDTTGPDPFTWGRAPFDFLADLEYKRLARLAETCGKAIKVSDPDLCPVVAPACRVITIAGRDSIVYNGGRQIVEIQLGDGTTHQVRRVNARITAPKGARLIKF